jgi:hypothetical protein
VRKHQIELGADSRYEVNGSGWRSRVVLAIIDRPRYSSSVIFHGPPGPFGLGSDVGNFVPSSAYSVTSILVAWSGLAEAPLSSQNVVITYAPPLGVGPSRRMLVTTSPALQFLRIAEEETL